jgi:hypothetical protein
MASKSYVVAPDVKLYIDGVHYLPGDPIKDPAPHFLDIGAVIEASAKPSTTD